MNMLALFFLRNSRLPLCAFVAAALAMAGTAHMVKLHFTTALFMESWREYLFHGAAGLLFGWLFVEAMFNYARRWLADIRRQFLPSAALAVAAPVVFLVLMHQTRYFINDGPATLAMALGVLAAGLFGGKGAVTGIVIPESFLMLIEAGRMDGDFSVGIINSLRAMDPYNPRLYSLLAAIHRRQGNAFKESVALQVAGLLQNERAEK